VDIAENQQSHISLAELGVSKMRLVVACWGGTQVTGCSQIIPSARG
jgi:hypothetical protein